MSSATSGDLVIRIDSIDQLFNAPGIDPYSDKPSIVLGQPALEHAVRQGLKKSVRSWKGRRLVIELPAGQVTLEVQRKTPEAIRRFAAAKRSDNDALIRISRWRAVVGLIFAIIIACSLVTILALALNTFLSEAPDTLQGALVGIITIFCWATIWNPWDRLVYEWIGPAMENRILNSIATMEIVVRVEPASMDEAVPERAALQP